MDTARREAESPTGILRLPNEIILEIIQQLDSSDAGIFALSTSCKRLHHLALPIYLAGHGILDAPELASRDGLTLLFDGLDILSALRTALFIPSLKRIHCSFSLNSARRGYSSGAMDTFLRHIRSLAGFLSILERVDEVTLDFKDVNFWAVQENVDVLGRYTSALSTLLDVIVEKQCKTLDVDGGLFVVHPSQFRIVAPPMKNKHQSFISGVGRRLGSAFSGNGDSPGQAHIRLATFSIRSTMLLVHPWTMTTLNAAPNLVSLSITCVDIPTALGDALLSGFHAPSLKHVSLDLTCRFRATTIDRFLGRHPLLSTLDLGWDLLPLEDDVFSKDGVRHLTNLYAPPSYLRFLLTGKRAPALRHVRVLVKVAPHAPFNAENINRALDRCDAIRLDRIHLTLVVTVDHASSHWTGFFPVEDNEVPPERAGRVDSLRFARALELVASHPTDAFEALALRFLPSFPSLQSLSFSGCLQRHLDAAHFVTRVKQACPEIQLITLDGEAYPVNPSSA
ncbi:hypothetical protein C8R46DRAFT_1066081 [Mycena filopes]|nr:hypothetical protein C8R46DRAFT_1066081 [Mycena filopes]